MEGLSVLGFVFGILGLVAFVRLEKLTKELKAKGVLDEDYKEECCPLSVTVFLDFIGLKEVLARNAGVEPATFGFVDRRSIQLS